jgi:uncharacterized protein
MPHELLPPDAQARVPWKNGGGVSVVIADERRPGFAAGDWAGVVWQLGRTDIVAPGPFSDLSGFERLQVVVGGAGLHLDTPDGAIDLSRPWVVARYDGGTPVVSRLTRGPVAVVNLIARRDMTRIDLQALRSAESLPAAWSATLLYAPNDRASVIIDGETAVLPEAHALRLHAPAAVSCTAGAVIAASIRPLLLS